MFISSMRARAKGLLLPAVVAVTMLGSLAATAPASSSDEPQTAATVSSASVANRASSTTQTTRATFFRPANFNVLGADHTAPGGKRKGWDSGVVRIGRVAQMLTSHEIDVVGFQEFQPPQAQRFGEIMGTTWQTYPGVNNPDGPSVNSIGWRTDTWQLLEARTIPIPYFSGVPSKMPAVLLHNVNSGRRVWFFNTHNPADTRGPAQQWRDQGFALEVALANELRTAYPDAPFIALGDKNERGRYYCAVAPLTNMWAANGGYVDGSTCVPPANAAIDWIMGTRDVFFNGYRKVWNDFVARTSDHPLYYANAVIPASGPQGVDHVVVVAIPGLTTSVVNTVGDQAGELQRMTAAGASTTNARTVTESATPDANLMSLLTGRRVKPKADGHGVTPRTVAGQSVHAVSGRYSSSIFDLAHNNSLRTSFVYSRPEARIVPRSWNKANGGTDPYGVDDGTKKLTATVRAKNDHLAVTQWTNRVKRRGFGLSVIELSGVLQSGQKNAFRGPQYQRSVVKASRKVAAIRRAIQAQPTMSGRTLLVVTSTGGAQRPKAGHKWKQGYRVPMWITGPGVPAGTNLYHLNPTLASPGGAQPNYSGAQPVRTGDIANLVTRILRVPPVPGSTMGTDQTFQAFDPLLVPGG